MHIQSKANKHRSLQVPANPHHGKMEGLTLGSELSILNNLAGSQRNKETEIAAMSGIGCVVRDSVQYVPQNISFQGAGRDTGEPLLGVTWKQPRPLSLSTYGAHTENVLAKVKIR